MTFSLKIVVYTLKSVKQLPGVQNNSLVMNTPGSLDSPWWIHLGVSTPLWWIDQGVLTLLWWIHRRVDFLVYLEEASEQVNKKFLMTKRQGSKDSPVYKSQGSLHSLVVNTPGSRLRIWITSRIFKEILNPSYACLTGLGEVVWWKKPG